MVANPEADFSRKVTEAEYLEFERNSDLKHEFANGEIVAMSGASWHHTIICANFGRVVGNHVLDRNCTVVQSDIRLQVSVTRNYRYPDISIVCGEPQFVDNRNDTISNPLMIVEVLSPSTEIIDCNKKLEEYLRFESLHEYLLISQSEAKIEQYRRQDDGWFYSQVIGLDNSIVLPSIDYTLALADVYRNVAFDAEPDMTEQ